MRKLILASAIAAVLVGCDRSATTDQSPTATVEPTQTVEQAEVTPSQQFNEMVDAHFDARVALSPIFQAYLGIKDNYDQWGEVSDEADQIELDLITKQLAELEAFDASTLKGQDELSYRMALAAAKQSADLFKWRKYGYQFTQMGGMHDSAPSILINMHQVKSVEDAQAYIKRLIALGPYFDQAITRSLEQEKMGVMVPKFVFAHLLNVTTNMTTGAPYDDGADNTLWADIQKKVNALDIDPSVRDDLLAQATTALIEHTGPAYHRLAKMFKEQEQRATTEDGIWKLPNGGEYYSSRLALMTTTDMTADEIHELGLSEVARIHDEMRAIMKTVEFEGNLNDFFEDMRTAPEFYYENTPEGKQRYLDEATALIDTMNEHLDDYFGIKPKAPLVVKAVEPFREQTAGKAFYNAPALDGSRPGTYYANLYDMADMPTYQMEALAYHEGNPGHHMQIAINQELTTLPKFRRFGRYTAYSEGWGLYSEYLPKEMGFYQDPYSDFGRLAMELWRACRLVVDTGLHHKKWTREEAIQYLIDNTPNPAGDSTNAIERYIVMPGQATAYKIGMIKILELRENAKEELGDKFDIKGFHDVVLGNGAVPLHILEENVKVWADSLK